MSEANWPVLTDIADAPSVDRGVTNGIVRPFGGGNFVFGFHSLINDPSVVALQQNQVNFNPMAKGCRMQIALKRGASGGNTGFAVFGYVGLQGTSANDSAYILGLSDDDPANIVLRKGALVNGLPNNAPGDPATLGTLTRSTRTVAIDEWVHLRIDYIVNGTGDVTLKVSESDLSVDPVTAPIFVLVPGMETFTDDALGINTGSAPFTSGRAGKGFQSSATTRRGFVDQYKCDRQL